MKLLTLLCALVALICLATPRPASAIDARLALSNAWVQSHVEVGIGNTWQAKANDSFQDARPVPVAFARWRLERIIWKLGAEGETSRRIDVHDQWGLRAAAVWSIK